MNHPVEDDESSAAATDPLVVSRALLVGVKRGVSVEAERASLAALPESALDTLGPAERLACWLNCYNAAAQLLAADRPALYESRRRFFAADALTVAGTALSLDDIEHGLLRGRSKYGLGYLPRVRPSAFERRHRVDSIEPRVHFALNCAAASCPAIAAYSTDVDAELDDATALYLDRTVEFDPDAGPFGRGVVRVPRLCLWFRGDFGGAAGVRSLLREYDLIDTDDRPWVRYRGWDWTRRVGRFRDGEA
ncbi:DUF547 domain-containing protein [Halobaculum gomorrense]|uniref:DUF547 domain-containing protein n=1 Tax=Halobaculum gomorrense TaxID=43928 RepID=A0A1M5N1X7_9EURY|nr:DUF547 domain-containing protein [Halobaculum gomorrense]SHG83487.1 Protein of unknown function, DUF547 [Halobaculum gomorrense]